jgi:hypothetical protein
MAFGFSAGGWLAQALRAISPKPISAQGFILFILLTFQAREGLGTDA